MPRRTASTLLTTLAGAAILACTSSAAATPPKREFEERDLPIAPNIECPDGNTVYGGGHLVRRITTFYGKDDTRTREVRHFRFEGAFYSADRSRSVPYSGHARREENFVTGTVTLTGRRLVLELPGPDPAKTGREVLDGDSFETVFESGRPLAGFEAAVCAAVYPAS